MTTTTTADLVPATLDRPIPRRTARSPLAAVVHRVIAALAGAIDGAQLGPANGVETSRHTGARI